MNRPKAATPKRAVTTHALRNVLPRQHMPAPMTVVTSAPPLGYHWAQTGSDCVLAAITTAITTVIMLQLLLNH